MNGPTYQTARPQEVALLNDQEIQALHDAGYLVGDGDLDIPMDSLFDCPESEADSDEG